jgi:pimeloyl-ACP methyl ester carboxylesterase
MDARSDGEAGPGLLPGVRRNIELGGRGIIGYREVGMPGSRPTLVLLHGLGATADLNFGPLYLALANRYHLIAPDLRGHGSGIRSARPFSFGTCADDVAALIDATAGTAPSSAGAYVLGYSMGGPIAMLLARRRPDLVRGLVLSATAARFGLDGIGRALMFGAGLVGEAWLRLPSAPGLARTRWARRLVEVPRIPPLPALDSLSARLRPVSAAIPQLPHLLVASGNLARFHDAPWLHDLDVPTAVVVTTADRLVRPAHQRALAAAIPGARIVEVEGGHEICARHPWRFAAAVSAALRTLGTPGRPTVRPAARHSARRSSA